MKINKKVFFLMHFDVREEYLRARTKLRFVFDIFPHEIDYHVGSIETTQLFPVFQLETLYEAPALKIVPVEIS